MRDPEKGTEYVCSVCGTTLVVTREGLGILEDTVCCEKPIQAQIPKRKRMARIKKKSRKR